MIPAAADAAAVAVAQPKGAAGLGHVWEQVPVAGELVSTVAVVLVWVLMGQVVAVVVGVLQRTWVLVVIPVVAVA